MIDLLYYLIEVSLVMSMLYLFYLAFLKKEIFFQVSRYYLLLAIVVSFIFPFMRLEAIPLGFEIFQDPISQINEIRTSYQSSVGGWSSADELQELSMNHILKAYGLLILFVIYVTGAGIVLFKFIRSLYLIARLKRSSSDAKIDGISVVWVPYSITPFSFLNQVFVPKTLMSDKDTSQILLHEQTHIDQKHTIDLLVVQFLAAFLWFNPVIWLLIKSLKETHEYIVDKLMINRGCSLVEYQSLLLRQLIGNNSFGLVNNFNLSFIKKRITKMKNHQSTWFGKLKVVLLLVSSFAFSLLIVRCNYEFESTIVRDDLATFRSGVQAKDSSAPTFKLLTDKGEVNIEKGIPRKTPTMYIRALPIDKSSKWKFRTSLVELTLVHDGRGVGSLRGGSEVNLSKIGEYSKKGDLLVVQIKSYERMDLAGMVEMVEMVEPITFEISLN